MAAGRKNCTSYPNGLRGFSRVAASGPDRHSKAGQSRIALVVCSDNRLLWQSAHLLHQARELEGRGGIDLFYYTSDPISAGLEHLFEGITLVHFDVDLPDNGYGRPDYISSAALLRIYALDALAQHYQHVAYLDSDVFLRWGKLSDLTRLSFDGAPLAAVRDRAHWGAEVEQWVARKYLPSLPEGARSRYFNSGVLIINSDVYAAQEVSSRALHFLEHHPDICHYGDQSALNAAINGNWAELSPSWNWQANTRYDFMIPARDPRIVHFTGPVKPWKDRMRRFDEYYWQTMRRWLVKNGLLDQFAASIQQPFDASKDRMRARLASERSTTPMQMREFSKPYLHRKDFADMQSGIQAWGWSET